MNFNKLTKDNKERKYSYNFDTDVMHHYFIETFKEYFQKGKMLEIGSYKGQFTERLYKYNQNITCVDASEEAIDEAKRWIDVKFILGKFEDIDFGEQKFDNIIATHILEHVDNPSIFLRKINSLLTPEGTAIICVPNALAPSRQIAVKMGLIDRTISVTEGEKQQGHKRTYTLYSLRTQANDAFLNVQKASGIFFKALANFQWDQILEKQIVSKEFLDGCYELGKEYPELCASIYLICKK